MKTILFDLDGTLLDTAPEFYEVINELLSEHNVSKVYYETFRNTVSQGARGMICHAFSMTIDHPNFPLLRQQYLNKYAKNLGFKTKPFAGIVELIKKIQQHGLKWGIITNKPSRFSTELIKQFSFIPDDICLVSGDTLASAKPNPDPLIYACHLLDSKPEDCVYIGDAEIDMLAAQQANITGIAALYGYIIAGQDPNDWPATHTVDSVAELWPLLSSKLT